MLFSTPHYLPKSLSRRYRQSAFVLYLLFIVLSIVAVLSFLFPYETANYTFGQNTSSKNTLLLPRNKNFESNENGKVAPGDTLSLLAGSWNTLESIHITLVPSKKSQGLFEGQTLTFRRGHGAAFAPQKDIPLSFSSFPLWQRNGTYYVEKLPGVLTPFVSEGAFLSQYPQELALPITEEALKTKIFSETLEGFRPGTLIAFADGVFITSENLEFSAFASPEVLLRLGYSFDHVYAATAEEVGIYKRTATLLPGAVHTPGTLFFDEATNEILLLKDGALWPLTTDYENFLVTRNDIIPLSSETLTQTSSCTLHKNFWRRSFSCTASTLPLTAAGDNFSITLSNNSLDTLDVATITAGLQASRQKENALRILQNIRNNLFERFGITYE